MVLAIAQTRMKLGTHRRGNKYSAGEITQRRDSTMGDRSPKSVQKKASQKQAKNDGANKQKQAQVDAQQAAKNKLPAGKKK